MELSDALRRFRREGVGSAALQQRIALSGSAEKGQMVNMSRLVEIQRRASMQLVVQRFSLGMHEGSDRIVVFVRCSRCQGHFHGTGQRPARVTLRP
ncbi:hypothetical protein D3C80_1883080 [compost metagenome]